MAGTCTSAARSSSSISARLGVEDATVPAGFLTALQGFWKEVEAGGPVRWREGGASFAIVASTTPECR